MCSLTCELVWLRGPVGAFYAVDCEVCVRQVISGGADLGGLEEADVAICEQEVARALPGPPAFIRVYRRVVAEPFPDEYLAGWMTNIRTVLGDGRLRICIGVGRAAHGVDLLRTVIEGHRVGVTGGFVFFLGDAVVRAKQNGGIIHIDAASQVRLDKGSPAASHPQPIACRQRVLGTGICIIACIQVQVHGQVDLLEIVGAGQTHSRRLGLHERGRKYGKQKGDDCDDNKQLDEGKAGPN